MRHALLPKLALVAALGILPGVSTAATADQRPEGVTGATWQFGPLNRWAYTHMNEVLPSKHIRSNPAAINPLEGRDSAVDDIGLSVDGEETTLADLVETLYIDGVLVLVDGKVALERYSGTLTPDRTHLLWSVSKTITGLTAASVVADGDLDLDKTVADYVPELADSGWGPDTLRDVLDMRDASAWNEDYSAPDSTVRRQDCSDGLLTGSDCEGVPVVGNYVFLPAVARDEERVGTFVYKSGTTDVMAWVLEAATGKRFADLVSEHIWQPMGAERDAGITVDVGGFTLASGGIHATLGDVARVGQLMLDRGRVGETQLFAESWMDDVFSRDGSRSWPFPIEGAKPYYRSFIWGLGDGRGSVQAQGVHGQAIYVAPESGVVIAMLSSWPDALGGVPGVDGEEQLKVMRALEAAFSR